MNKHRRQCQGLAEMLSRRRKLLKDIPPEPRRLAVASLRLNTEYDILGKHLNRLGILPSASCILCHQQEDMDRQHLAKCPALKFSKEVDRYWEARARIIPYDISLFHAKSVNYVSWTARSPDLSTLDLSELGHMKPEVYDTPAALVEDLEIRVVTAAHGLREISDMFVIVRRSMMSKEEMEDATFVEGQRTKIQGSLVRHVTTGVARHLKKIHTTCFEEGEEVSESDDVEDI
ncbi:hypothetical protein ANN_00892 [Periplaneta americana]|uniref:Uncharacterized protein n=1 Tax=Periplaneta americana TaxID=6978 RepID=A0ABQ8TUY2_PERAM|nr:hypothetical protein ANN_00892 [Periplaneta americana]